MLRFSMRSKQKIINLYKDKNISIIKTVISVAYEEDLNIFWDFFMNYKTLNEDDVNNFTMLVYNLLSKQFKYEDSTFVDIFIEESEDVIYISFRNKLIVEKLINKDITIAFKNDSKVVTFKLEKTAMKAIESVKTLQVVEPKNKPSYKLKEIPKIDINIETKDVELDAFVLEQLEQFIKEDLNELTDTHNDIDSSIIEILQKIETSKISADILYKLKNSFEKYASIISYYPFFKDLGQSLASFANIMKHNELPEDEELVKNIFNILESFMYVLGKWQDDLKRNDLRSVNRLDASLISDMQTITNLWLGKFETDDVGEMEFF